MVTVLLFQTSEFIKYTASKRWKSKQESVGGNSEVITKSRVHKHPAEINQGSPSKKASWGQLIC